MVRHCRKEKLKSPRIKALKKYIQEIAKDVDSRFMYEKLGRGLIRQIEDDIDFVLEGDK